MASCPNRFASTTICTNVSRRRLGPMPHRRITSRSIRCDPNSTIAGSVRVPPAVVSPFATVPWMWTVMSIDSDDSSGNKCFAALTAGSFSAHAMAIVSAWVSVSTFVPCFAWFGLHHSSGCESKAAGCGGTAANRPATERRQLRAGRVMSSVAEIDGRQATLEGRVSASGAWWSQILRLCPEFCETRELVRDCPRGLYASGVHCLILYEDVRLSIPAIAVLLNYDKGHVSRKIHQTRSVLRSVIQPPTVPSQPRGDDDGDDVREMNPDRESPQTVPAMRLQRVDRREPDRMNPAHDTRPPRFHPLTEREWRRIEPLIPRATSGRIGNPRRTANAVLWKVTTSREWSELPKLFGPWRTAYKPYRRWLNDGTLDAIVERFHAARSPTVRKRKSE